MPFAPIWTAEAAGRYFALRKAAAASLKNRQKNKRSKATKAEGLFKQVEKCVRLLLRDPRHPGLNTHEFESIEHPYDKAGKVFEAYVQHRTPGDCRLFWCYGPQRGQITIIAITPHPQRGVPRTIVVDDSKLECLRIRKREVAATASRSTGSRTIS